MTLNHLIAAFHAWIDQVASALAFIHAQLRSEGVVCVIETDDNVFAILPPSGPGTFHLRPEGRIPEHVAAALTGRTVELVLSPARFVFCPVELPKAAASFLDGVVRAQIDRVTPWSVSDATFGYGSPKDIGDERICVTVAATMKARLEPVLVALKAQGTRAVSVLVKTETDDPVRVMEGGLATNGADHRIHRILLIVLGVAAASAALALLASDWVGTALDAQLDEARTRATVERTRAITAVEKQGDSALEARKREVPSVTLMLEALSDILPDDTYLTELRMDGDKVEITGHSLEAPGLIRRLERSRRFSEATFIAPTLRQPGEVGERFQIKARILLPQEVP